MSAELVPKLAKTAVDAVTGGFGGESLHKRGYRVRNTEAPLSEALAAGMLLLAGWQGQSDLYDPMCGSGTLLIEAALIAQNIAPGIFRKGFGFEKWPDFNKELFEEIYNDDSRDRVFTHRIYGSDTSFYAVKTAEENVKSAGVNRMVEVHQIRMQEIKHEGGTPGAMVVINPPYGERLAILLNEVKSKGGKKVVQTISYLPHFLSWIIVTGILHDALSGTGIVNELLLKLGILSQPLNFFAYPKYFWAIVAFANVWKETGWNAIIYLSAIF